MAKAFNRLRKQVQDRRSNEKTPNMWGRVRRLEEHLFELSALICKSVIEQSESPEEPSMSFAEAHEEFKKHLETVLKEDKRG